MATPFPLLRPLKNWRALDMPLYALLYDGTELPRAEEAESPADDWTSQVKGERVFKKLRRALSQMGETDRQLLLKMAEKMITAKRPKKSQIAEKIDPQ